MTTTSPALICRWLTASNVASSLSNTRAGPLNCSLWTPLGFSPQPPGAVQVRLHEASPRPHVGDVRHPAGDGVEVVERHLDAGLTGDRRQVESGVGGATDRHNDGDGVLE